MSGADKVAACVVMTIWGLNFIAIKVGVADVPPLLLGALRFIFLVFPAIFFVPRPQVSVGVLAAYALTISFGQFAFLFTALYVGMPAGLASLVLQVQAFIAPVIAILALGERLGRRTAMGLAIAFGGLLLLAVASNFNQSVSMLGFVLTLCAAASWAVGNVLSRHIGRVNPLSLVVWSALIPIVPFLAVSAAIEGPHMMGHALQNITWPAVGAVAYLSYGASLIGYGLWSTLLTRNPIQVIAPLTLSIPIIGMVAAWFVLGETLTPLQIAGSVIIIAGLVVNLGGVGFVAGLLKPWRRG